MGVTYRCHTARVNLRSKFQLKSGQAIDVVGAPDSIIGLLSELETDETSDVGPALLAFVANFAALKKLDTMIIKAATSDRLTWLAYPKAGQLGTDLNRDTLAASLIEGGARPVRQVALDDVWSALRFRSA